MVSALNYKASALYPSHVAICAPDDKPPLILLLAHAKLGNTSLGVLADDEVVC